jgi:uncharacterized protein
VLQQLLDLYEIQKIDVTIRDVQKRLDEIPAALRKLESSVSTLKSEHDKIRLERDTVARDIRDLEGNIALETTKLRKWEARLNDIRNQREYLALSREVEGGKRQNREAEERLAALKAKHDELEKRMAEMAAQIGTQEGEASGERDKVDSQSNDVKTNLSSEMARREQLVPKIPRPLLSKYDAIRAKRLGVGIVPVVGGNCQGCNMKVPPQLFNTLQRGQTIEQCPSCQRIIFWDNFLNQAKAEGGTPGKQAAAQP